MMREVIRTKRMPPWHADPHIGAWKNDKSLSVEQAQTLVHWIEAGAPRGSGEDPLKNHRQPAGMAAGGTRFDSRSSDLRHSRQWRSRIQISSAGQPDGPRSLG